MEREFVPYELAVKLKALGFDEPCLFAFDNCSTPMRCSDLRTNEQKFNGVNYNSSTYTSQPTLSQAFRWFREKYGLYSWVKLHNGYVNDSFYEKLPITWTVMEHKSGKQHYEKDTDNYLYHTHEEAELACLDKLIEIVESKSE